MAEFDVKITKLNQTKLSEDKVAAELHGIENEIQNIISNLRLTSKSATQIKNRLRHGMNEVSTARQKVQVLSRTLEEVARLYEETENRITGNTSEVKNGRLTNSGIAGTIRETSEKLRAVAGIMGLDSSSVFSRDPVNLCNGNYVYEKSFLKLDTIIPMEFRLFYNIQREDTGIFGKGWTHSYEIKLVVDQDKISMIRDDASLLTFLRGEGEAYYPLLGMFGSIVRTEQGFEVTDKDKFTYLFDAGGRWMRKKDPFGNELILTYDADELVMVKDNHGDFYTFKYEEGKIKEVSDHSGRKIWFQYEEGRLTSIKDSEGRVVSYHYDQNGWLTGLENGKGIACLKNEYDSTGRTIRQEFPDGGVVTYEYLDDSNQVKMTEQNGNVVIYERDHLYRNIKNIYENGEESFTYDENNQRTSFTDRNGNTSFYEYNAHGNLKSFTNPFNDRLQYSYTVLNQVESVALNGVILYRAAYNDKNLQESVENALGAKNRYEYNEVGQLVAWIQADGCKIEMTYDEAGNMKSVTNSMGGKTDYEYDDRHRVIRIIEPLGNTTEFSYNEADEIVQVKDAEGKVQQYEYDVCGNLIRAVDFAGGVTEVLYNALNKPVQVTNPENQSISMEYDKMWNLVKQTAADGGVTEYEYDRLHRLVKVTDPEGAVTHLSYDSCGNLIQRQAPDGGIYEISYDALNRPNQVTDPCGYMVSAEYDSSGNVTKVLYEDGSFEEYQYDLEGNMILSCDLNGYKKYYSYDISGNLLSVEDDDTWLEQYEYYPGGFLKKEKMRDGSGRNFEYDLNENIVKITNQDGCSWHFEYDSLGRIIHCNQDGGISESYEYDALDNIIAVTDGEGNKTIYDYSPCGDIKSVTDAMGYMTYYQYDACRRLIKVIQSENEDLNISAVNQLNQEQKNLRVISYERDKRGNIVKTIDPEGIEETYTYDACGRITTKRDGDGNLTQCIYNPDGTEKEYRFADGRSVKYQYNALKQLIQMEDWIGITSISNDVMGRVTQIVYPKGEKILYEWGKRGEQKRIVYPDGYQAEYLCDDALRLTELRVGADNVSYSYLENGRLKEKRNQNGFSTSYQYDPSGKIREICHRNQGNVLEKMTYQYDRNDRKSRITRERTGIEGGGVYDYKYNALGSLVSVLKNGMEEERYNYDRFGNRIQADIGGDEQKYIYNYVDQLLQMNDSRGEHRYSYDRRGNMTKEYLNGNPIMEAEFDVLNRLGQLKVGNKCVKYGYNGFGHRVFKSTFTAEEDKINTEYLYDIRKDYNNLLYVKNLDKTENVLWDGGLLGIESNNRNRFYMNDEQMSPLRIIGKDTVICNVHIDTFGNLNNCFLEEQLLFGYTGYQIDDVGGLYYANQREYRSSIGQFISKDTFPGLVMVPLTLNAYAYCMGNPVNYIDPTGQVWAWLAGGIVGAVANVACKVAGDVVKSVKAGKWEGSSWQSYVGTAVGGFASGAVFATTGNMTLAGAAGNAAETFTTGGLGMLTGAEGYRKEDGYSFGRLLGDTVVSTTEGAATGFAFGQAAKYIKIPGINKGRGSYEAVWKQVMTKAARGQIANISVKTIGKGIVNYGAVRFLDQIVQKGMGEFKDTVTGNMIDWSVDKIKKLEDTASIIRSSTLTAGAGAYLSTNVTSAACPAEGV